MSGSSNAKPFTGRHMAAVLIGGFGIVAIVNFYMASLATGGFHGVVVENTYVASQKFNDWIEEAKRTRALGWKATPARDEAGHVLLTTKDVPENAFITAELRRPLGTREYAALTFARLPNGSYRSNETVDAGRWTIRLSIKANGEDWTEERELK
ncbi:MAG: FixH family protein [Pseudomonadota bacterium]